jgi:hypothetical protein
VQQRGERPHMRFAGFLTDVPSGCAYGVSKEAFKPQGA